MWRSEVVALLAGEMQVHFRGRDEPRLSEKQHGQGGWRQLRRENRVGVGRLKALWVTLTFALCKIGDTEGSGDRSDISLQCSKDVGAGSPRGARTETGTWSRKPLC